jgi:hypothetical protein
MAFRELLVGYILLHPNDVVNGSNLGSVFLPIKSHRQVWLVDVLSIRTDGYKTGNRKD